jgi:hypothetical protein
MFLWASLQRPGLARFLFLTIAGSGILGLLAEPRATAAPQSLYVDYRYFKDSITKVGARPIYVLGPNPFKTVWKIDVQSTTLPGPDVSSIISKTLSLPKGIGGTNAAASPLPTQPPPDPNASPCATRNYSVSRDFSAPDWTAPDVTHYPTQCVALYAYDVNVFQRVSQRLVTAETAVINNVNTIAQIPPGGATPTASPDAQSDSQSRSSFFNTYESSVLACVVQPTPGRTAGLSCSTTLPSPCPTPACSITLKSPTYDSNGTVAEVQRDAKNANAWAKLADDDYNAINPYLSAQSDQAKIKAVNYVLSQALQDTTYTQAQSAATDSNSAFVKAGSTDLTSFTPLLVASVDPDCRGTLWNGVQYTYTISTASPSPQPSGTNTQQPGQTRTGSATVDSLSRFWNIIAYAPGRVADALRGGGGATPTPTPTPKDDNSNGPAIVITCPPPAFISLGLGADFLQTSTYKAVPMNAAGTTAFPLHAKAPPAVILQSAKPPRTLFSQFVNYQLSSDDDGSGAGISFGPGWALSDAGPSQPDILFGPFYTYRRGLTLSAGLTYGSTNQLQSGYSLNGPIKKGMTPPTYSANRAGVFVILSVFDFHGGTSDASDKTKKRSGDNGSQSP